MFDPNAKFLTQIALGQQGKIKIKVGKKNSSGLNLRLEDDY